MNAPCILRQIRLQAQGLGVLLRTPGYLSQPVTKIRAEDGVFEAISTDYGWMLVDVPERGLLGLPLSGKGSTWETQWEYLDVKVEICTAKGWTEVRDWSLVERALTHK